MKCALVLIAFATFSINALAQAKETKVVQNQTNTTEKNNENKENKTSEVQTEDNGCIKINSFQLKFNGKYIPPGEKRYGVDVSKIQVPITVAGTTNNNDGTRSTTIRTGNISGYPAPSDQSVIPKAPNTQPVQIEVYFIDFKMSVYNSGDKPITSFKVSFLIGDAEKNKILKRYNFKAKEVIEPKHATNVYFSKTTTSILIPKPSLYQDAVITEIEFTDGTKWKRPKDAK